MVLDGRSSYPATQRTGGERFKSQANEISVSARLPLLAGMPGLSEAFGLLWRSMGPLARGLLPPPPLRAFDTLPLPDRIRDEERDERQKGAVDARTCLHCGTLTYAQHTQSVMQTSFKSPAPSFIEEIQRHLRATTMRAQHIIFMGTRCRRMVSPDRLFLRSRQRSKDLVYCTIVGKDEEP